MSGIDAATIIRQQLTVPVVSLTAFGVPDTVAHATSASPYGYIIKPFSDDALRSGIETALQRYKLESELRASRQQFATTLESITDAVVAVDSAGCITFLNRAATFLTERLSDDVLGLQLDEVRHVIEADTNKAVENPCQIAMRTARSCAPCAKRSTRRSSIEQSGYGESVKVLLAPCDRRFHGRSVIYSRRGILYPRQFLNISACFPFIHLPTTHHSSQTEIRSSIIDKAWSMRKSSSCSVRT
jgi:PAS domain-containing protein